MAPEAELGICGYVATGQGTPKIAGVCVLSRFSRV